MFIVFGTLYLFALIIVVIFGTLYLFGLIIVVIRKVIFAIIIIIQKEKENGILLLDLCVCHFLGGGGVCACVCHDLSEHKVRMRQDGTQNESTSQAK